MKEVDLDQLSKLSWANASNSQCFKVIDSNGETALIAVTRPMEAMKVRIEAICSQIDAGRDRPLIAPKTSTRKPKTLMETFSDEQLVKVAGLDEHDSI
jgi:hypothetical protein